jgi:hypothetical protein
VEIAVSESNSRDNRRRALGETRQGQDQRKRGLRLAAWAGAVVVAAGAGIGIGVGLSGSSSGATSGSGSYAPLSSLGTLAAASAPGPLGSEKVPVPAGAVLAPVSAATTGQTIDGVECSTSEQLKFHIHAHLTIFVNGKQQQVPGGIGIPDAVSTPTQGGGSFIFSGKCLYWLHTHTADGIIHVESPKVATYTLGQFFDEWGQPLSSSQVGPAKGKVTAIVNGQVFQGNPRAIPLASHENLQLEVGTPLVTPQFINWSITGL